MESLWRNCYVKKKKKEIEDISYEELLKKCQNQQASLKIANDKIKSLSRKVALYEEIFSNSKISTKVIVAAEETLSCFDEIEFLKTEIEKLKKGGIE